MLETPHVVIGALIATKIANPVLAIPLSFLSHFALEQVPHWNPHLNTEKKKYGKITTQSTAIVIGDVIVSLALGGFIATRFMPDFGRTLTVLFSSFFAVLPDVIEGPYFFLNMKSEFIDKWIKFQKALQVDTTPFWGLATQVVTIIAAFIWLYS